MHVEGKKNMDDENISEDDILQAMLKEFGFFDEDSYPLTVPNKPAKPASHDDLQQSLDWQQTITTSDKPCIPSSDIANSTTIPTNNNTLVSWERKTYLNFQWPYMPNGRHDIAFMGDYSCMKRESAKKCSTNMWGKLLFAANEMSLLTTELLYLLSQITSAFQATEGIPPQLVTAPFGGLSVIILGDFHQFPPITGHHHALYSQNPQTAKCQLGRNIYLQFNTVIQLQQQICIMDTVWHNNLKKNAKFKFLKIAKLTLQFKQMFANYSANLNIAPSKIRAIKIAYTLSTIWIVKCITTKLGYTNWKMALMYMSATALPAFSRIPSSSKQPLEVPDNEDQTSKKGCIQDPNVPFLIEDEVSDLVIDYTEDDLDIDEPQVEHIPDHNFMPEADDHSQDYDLDTYKNTDNLDHDVPKASDNCQVLEPNFGDNSTGHKEAEEAGLEAENLEGIHLDMDPNHNCDEADIAPAHTMGWMDEDLEELHHMA
ncbi:hypothetical protein EDB19DRAFT_1824175 [Suillus lakei]|nr:hypothetical protein EDB19DRAFT_1824175 [Suillus lakei]